MLAPRELQPSHRPLLMVAGGALAAAASVRWLLQRRWHGPSTSNARAAQGLAAGAAVLCLSVALDSGLEHYRGRFKDPFMFVGPSVAALGVGVSAFLASRPAFANLRAPQIAFAAIGAGGVIGLGFHAYNIVKRPGELSAINLFYAAPAAAPAALSIAGAFGYLAGCFIASESIPSNKTLARLTAGLVCASLIGTSAEAGFLHFRGAFQNPAMYAPVVLPPIAALSIGAAALSPRSAAIAEPLLKATAVLGIAGPMLHAYGIHRNMGGWRNWSQMILQGPPLPAPPAFLGIAIAGLGTLPLLNEVRR